jgi:hypothetical protein
MREINEDEKVKRRREIQQEETITHNVGWAHSPCLARAKRVLTYMPPSHAQALLNILLELITKFYSLQTCIKYGGKLQPNKVLVPERKKKQ